MRTWLLRLKHSALKKIAAGAKQLGLETKITGNKLIIGDESYAPDELKAIPSAIMNAAKQESQVKDGIAFKGDRSVFSISNTRVRTLYCGIYAKFDQNIPLKQALLNTIGLNLYEATTDLFWACGVDID